MSKKIIVSVLVGGGDHFEKMEAAARDTCFKKMLLKIFPYIMFTIIVTVYLYKRASQSS